MVNFLTWTITPHANLTRGIAGNKGCFLFSVKPDVRKTEIDPLFSRQSSYLFATSLADDLVCLCQTRPPSPHVPQPWKLLVQYDTAQGNLSAILPSTSPTVPDCRINKHVVIHVGVFPVLSLPERPPHFLVFRVLSWRNFTVAPLQIIRKKVAACGKKRQAHFYRCLALT